VYPVDERAQRQLVVRVSPGIEPTEVDSDLQDGAVVGEHDDRVL
jgi:hypothetical protein